MTRLPPVFASLLLALLLAGCSDAPPQALGTLEYDRISVPAPVAERIVSIEVREGERVQAGQGLMQLEATRVRATTEAARAWRWARISRSNPWIRAWACLPRRRAPTPRACRKAAGTRKTS